MKGKLLQKSPRLLATAPMLSDFNLSFDPDDDDVESVGSAVELRTELAAWDAASDLVIHIGEA